MHPKKDPTRRRYKIALLAASLGGYAGLVTAEESQDRYDEHALDEIVVEGIPLDRTINELAQPASILGGDELAKRQAASLGEISRCSASRAEVSRVSLEYAGTSSEPTK